MQNKAQRAEECRICHRKGSAINGPHQSSTEVYQKNRALLGAVSTISFRGNTAISEIFGIWIQKVPFWTSGEKN